jgi:hypothetical protein
MREDYQYLRGRQEYIRTRKASQRFDEEPDVDALGYSERLEGEELGRAVRIQRQHALEDRGLGRTPRLSDQDN